MLKFTVAVTKLLTPLESVQQGLPIYTNHTLKAFWSVIVNISRTAIVNI